MNAGLPVSQLGSVALAAKFVRLGEVDQSTIGKVQLITILLVVTVEAPSVVRVMTEPDILMKLRQNPFRSVWLYIQVTVRAGERLLTQW